MFTSLYKRLFVPEADEGLSTTETDSLIDSALSPSVEGRLTVGLSPIGTSMFDKKADQTSVNMAPWLRGTIYHCGCGFLTIIIGTPYNVPYAPPKLRRPDRLPVDTTIPRSESSSSDDSEFFETSCMFRPFS